MYTLGTMTERIRCWHISSNPPSYETPVKRSYLAIGRVGKFCVTVQGALQQLHLKGSKDPKGHAGTAKKALCNFSVFYSFF